MLQGTKGADESKLPAIVVENLTFYREHKTEIESAFKDFSAKAASAGEANLDEEDEAEGETEGER